MGEFKYIRETDRPIASVIVCARKPSDPIPEDEPEEIPIEEELPVQFDPHEESEDTPMEDNNIEKEETVTEVIKDEGWTDPEPKGSIIVERIAALLSVKSIITIALTVAFIILVINGRDLPDQFVSVYTMCLSFFFGYQFKKAESGGDK